MEQERELAAVAEALAGWFVWAAAWNCNRAASGLEQVLGVVVLEVLPIVKTIFRQE